jgi:hypothetical protein
MCPVFYPKLYYPFYNLRDNLLFELIFRTFQVQFRLKLNTLDLISQFINSTQERFRVIQLTNTFIVIFFNVW